MLSTQRHVAQRATTRINARVAAAGDTPARGAARDPHVVHPDGRREPREHAHVRRVAHADARRTLAVPQRGARRTRRDCTRRSSTSSGVVACAPVSTRVRGGRVVGSRAEPGPGRARRIADGSTSDRGHRLHARSGLALATVVKPAPAGTRRSRPGFSRTTWARVRLLRASRSSTSGSGATSGAASRSRCGRIRSSHLGSHQLASPMRLIVDGHEDHADERGVEEHGDGEAEAEHLDRRRRRRRRRRGTR